MLKIKKKKCKLKLHLDITSHHNQKVAIKKKKSTNKNAGESMKKRKPSYTVGGNVNWYNPYGEQYGGYLKMLKQQYCLIAKTWKQTK